MVRATDQIFQLSLDVKLGSDSLQQAVGGGDTDGAPRADPQEAPKKV